MKLIIPTNPRSDNNLYGHYAIGKRVIRFMTKEGKDYKKLCLTLIPKGTLASDKPIRMSIDVYFGDKRKRDIQGHLKALIDSFNKVLYNDDSQIIEVTARKFYSKENPRSEVIVEEIIEESQSKLNHAE